MKRHAFLTLLIASILLCTKALAYDFKYITTREGLTNSSILSLCLKENGQLAIGTCDGVNAFDGTFAWRLQPANNGEPIRGNIIEDMEEGRSGVLWVLTNHGLNRLENIRGVSSTFYPKMIGSKNIRKNPAKDIFILANEMMYCTNGTNNSFQEILLQGVFPSEVRDYAVTDKYLYLFTHSGIKRYSIATQGQGYTLSNAITLTDEPLQHASVDGDIAYIVNLKGMLQCFYLNTEQTADLQSLTDVMEERGEVAQILRFKDEIIVSFSNNGVIFLAKSEANDGYEVTLQTEGVGILSLLKNEATNTVWMGTDGQGLLKYSEAPYHHTSITYDELWIDIAKPTRDITLDREGTLWLSTKGGGIIALPHFDAATASHNSPRTIYTQHNSDLSDNRVYGFAESTDREGFWICNEAGMDFYSYTKHGIINIPFEIPEGVAKPRYIIDAYEHEGVLWMASMGEGIYKADITGERGAPRLTNLERFTLDNGEVSSNYFFDIAHNEQGKLWFANRGKGVYEIDNGTLRRIHYKNTYKDDGVNDVFAVLPVGKDLWIGTGHGIIIQRGTGTEQHITTDNGLSNNTIHSLIADGEKHIFATTNNGIACFNNGSLYPTVLNSDMEVTEYSDGATYMNNGRIFFGGVNGISTLWFDKSVTVSSPAPRIDFTALSIFDKPVNMYEFINFDEKHPRLTLNHKQNSFRLRLSTMDYVQAANTQYYYRLSNNDDWMPTDQTNSVSLSLLPSGTHTLQIKYNNRISGNESPLFLLTIRITPPWYFSTVAFIIYTLMVLCFVATLWYMWWHRVKGRQQVELMRMQKRHADQVHEEKLNFLTNVVHELNTPLTLIYGPCERILNYAHTDAFIRKYMQLITQNLGRLNYLIQEIIDFRRITTGHHQIEIRRVDVSSIIDDAIDAFQEIAVENNITFEHEVEDSLIWNSDDRALIRISSNLISNAFKYTKRGGTIRVTLATDKTDADNPTIKLTVYNTGKGIAPEQKAHIFDYYSVLESANESSTRGLTSRNGLGMSICYKMVKKLQGHIEIDSEVGQYAQFNVTLPQQTLPEGTSDEIIVAKRNISGLEAKIEATPSQDTSLPCTLTKNEQSNVEPATTPEGGQYTILVIDDNTDILEMLVDCLEGYNTITAKSGEEGFEKMKEMIPDLIITDIMMPGINGLDFTQSVKKNKHTMHVPLVILSAKGSDDERIEGLESGADIYISKPFNINYLLITVRRLLENSKVLKEYYNSSASAYTFTSGKLVKNEERDFMNEVIRIINENLTNTEFSPEDLAAKLGVSGRNLYRKFSELDLPTPNNFIKTHKIETAAKLIITTDMTIQEIIYSIGFNTRSQFYNEFRKHFQMTPKQYREQHLVRDERL